MEAILILDDFDNYFHYSPEPISPCLLPVGDSILIENLISWIKRTCIYSLTLVTSNNAIFNDFKKYSTMSNSSLKIHIIEVDKQSKSLGDFIRNIAISLNLQNDFLLIHGNTYLCHDLDEPIKKHMELKSKKPNLEATILLSRIKPNELIRSKNEQNIYITTNEGRILCYGNFNTANKFGLEYEQLKKYKLGENYSLRLNYDLVNSGIIICTNKIVEKFKTCFDFKTIDDYILNVVNDELECGEIFNYVLDKPIGTDSHTLFIAGYNIYYEFLKLVSFTFEKFSKFNMLPQLKFESNIDGNIDNSKVKDSVISSTSNVISSWIYNSTISDNCNITNSIVFNSEVQSNVTITNSLIIGNCLIKQGIKISGTIVGNTFRITDVNTDILNQVNLYGNKVDLAPPSIYSDVESISSGSSSEEDIQNVDKIDTVTDKDLTNFENEVFDMISDILINPKYVQYSILELKGLRLAYNVQNIHMTQALLYPIVNWLCNNYPDHNDWENALEEAKIDTIFCPFIEEDDKIAHFGAFSKLLKICNNDTFDDNNLRFCHVCEALNSVNLLNFDFLPEWYNGLNDEEKNNSSLKEMRFKAFLNWLNE